MSNQPSLRYLLGGDRRPPRSRRFWQSLAMLAAVTAGIGLVAVGLIIGQPSAEAAIPTPGTNQSVVVVHVGGDRTSFGGGVSPLEGVVLGLYDGDANGPTGSAIMTCASDAQGHCSFIINDTGSGGANNSDRFWVVQESAPAGWYTNTQLRTGGTGHPTSNARPYQFRTPAMQAGQTYESGVGFMQRGNDETHSEGIWQQSRTNPGFPTQCGMDVALVLDLSSSIAIGGVTAQLKSAADSFVGALQGTPSRMAVFGFGWDSPAVEANNNTNQTALLPVVTASDANAFKQIYANWDPDGATNWDRAFQAVAQANTINNHYDVVVFVTDGNPTVYGANPGNSVFNNGNSLRDVENAVFSANWVKSQGSRIIAVAVGPGVQPASHADLNLRAVSGPNAGSDYYQFSTFDEAASELRHVALEGCVPSVTVVKQIIPADGDFEDAYTPAEAWTFSASSETGGVSIAPTSAQTGPSGAVAFTPDFGNLDIDTIGTFSFAETPQTGFTHRPLPDGRNADCTIRSRDSWEESRPLTDAEYENLEDGGFSIDMTREDGVSCVIYNQVIPTPELELEKLVVDANNNFGVIDKNGNGLKDIGDWIYYQFELTNNGNVTLSDLTIHDAMLAGQADPAITITCDTTSLPPQQSTTCTAQAPYVVTASDAVVQEVHNIAYATGKPPGWQESDDLVESNHDETTTPLDQAGELTLDKEVVQVVDKNGNQLTDTGDEIWYEFTLENTGAVTLTDLVVNDPLLASLNVSITCDVTELAPENSTTCTAQAPYVITALDMLTLESIDNVATATGKDPGDNDVTSNEDETSTPLDASAILTLDKRVARVVDVNTNGITDAGDEIWYEFTVTNDGTLPLTSIAVDDPLLAAQTPPITVACDDTALDPGKSTECEAQAGYVITLADMRAETVDNIATATGIDPDDNEIESEPDETSTPLEWRTSLLLDKRVAEIVDVNENGITDAGDEIRYEFTVTNNSTVTLTNIEVIDDLLSAQTPPITVTCDDTTLGAGESTECDATAGYVITIDDMFAETVDNVATATGTDPFEEEVESNPDETSTPLEWRTSLVLDKRVAEIVDVNENELTDAGDEIWYEFEVTNTGTVALSNVAIADALLANLAPPIAITCPEAPVAPGASIVCTADEAYIITVEDVRGGLVENVATATGDDPFEDPVESNEDETETPLDQVAVLVLEKRVASVVDVNENELTDAGDEIWYEFDLRNDGDVTITDLSIDDALLAGLGIDITCGATELGPDESTTCEALEAYVIQIEDMPTGAIENVATASGLDPDEEPVESNPDETTTPLDWTPELELDKRVVEVVDVNSNGLNDTGDEIGYEFELTNAGEATLTDLEVDDPLLVSRGITITCLATTLEPGDSTVCTADSAYVVTLADMNTGEVHNVATASGLDPNEEPVPSNEDETVTPLDVEPELTLDKRVALLVDTNVNGRTDIGDLIWFEFRLTNSGNVTIASLDIHDPLLETRGIAIACAATTLDPGQSTLCTAQTPYAITAADVATGSVHNVATSTGRDPEDEPVESNPDETTTPVEPPSAIPSPTPTPTPTAPPVATQPLPSAPAATTPAPTPTPRPELTLSESEEPPVKNPGVPNPAKAGMGWIRDQEVPGQLGSVLTNGMRWMRDLDVLATAAIAGLVLFGITGGLLRRARRDEEGSA